MKRRWASLVVMGILATAGQAFAAESPPTYHLVWQDEFNGPAGQLPDSTKWQFDVGTDWGNAQLEWDTDLARNVSLDGAGHLAITARAEEFAGQSYTSGRIKTKDLFERTYGRFAARIKLPLGQGIWPAFWLLGADIDDNPWPGCGEIDIMEYRGHEPRVLHGTIHGTGHFGDDAITSRFLLSGGTFNEAFHEFAVEWDADGITWFVDGEIFHQVSPGDLPDEAVWVYDHPFFILLNVAVGGRWPGPPDAATVFPQSMLIDYVRVYAK